jgi:hypothetical protein
MDAKPEAATEGPVAFAAMTGTDVATYTRERPGMSAFALEDGVSTTPIPPMRAGWTASGACTSGSTALQGAQRDGPLVSPPRRVRQALSEVVRLDDVDGVDADARTYVARRRGVVPWHVGRDDGGPTRGTATAYSTTSTARNRIACGSARPSAFAVLPLMTRSSFVGSSTGNSAGCAPFKTLSM